MNATHVTCQEDRFPIFVDDIRYLNTWTSAKRRWVVERDLLVRPTQEDTEAALTALNVAHLIPHISPEKLAACMVFDGDVLDGDSDYDRALCAAYWGGPAFWAPIVGELSNYGEMYGAVQRRLATVLGRAALFRESRGHSVLSIYDDGLMKVEDLDVVLLNAVPSGLWATLKLGCRCFEKEVSVAAITSDHQTRTAFQVMERRAFGDRAFGAEVLSNFNYYRITDDPANPFVYVC